MQHTIIKTATGYQCTVCFWTWKSKPQSTCPGVPRYDRGMAPASLKTKGQLAKAGLKPVFPRRAVVYIGRQDECDLFYEWEAMPFSAEEIAAQKETRRKARYRTCRVCHKEVRREKWDPEHKTCDKCLPGLLERIFARIAWDEENYADELRRMWDKDRDSSIQWARAFLTDPDALILDTETTGLEWNDQIVQIAVINPAIINPAPDVLINTLVNPGRPIPPEVIGIHGITDEMVKDAPAWKEIYDHLQQIVEGKKLASYNAAFDLRMIHQSGWIMDLPALKPKSFVCAMEQYAAFYGEWSEHHGSYRWQPLPSGDHSALGDCLAALEVIKKMASAKLSSEEESK